MKMQHHAVWKTFTYDSEEHAASIFMVYERLFAMMMEAACSSEKSMNIDQNSTTHHKRNL
jgi:hypothetical protein